jgi:hypothetical protein
MYDFLNKCLGTGLACFSYANAIGYYITFGLGLVRLKG